MAKKKASVSVVRAVRPSNEEADNRSLYEVASPVAAEVNLVTVIAQSFSATRTPEGMPEANNADIDMEVKVDEIGRVAEQSMINISIRFGIEAFVRSEETRHEQPSVKIGCQFLLIYHIPTLDGLTDEAITAFAKTSGVFSAWPYWREFVHSTSFRLGVEPIVLPTYRN